MASILKTSSCARRLRLSETSFKRAKPGSANPHGRIRRSAERYARLQNEVVELKQQAEEGQARVRELEATQEQLGMVESREMILREEQDKLKAQIADLQRELDTGKEKVQELDATCERLAEMERVCQELHEENRRLEEKFRDGRNGSLRVRKPKHRSAPFDSSSRNYKRSKRRSRKRIL